jgi:hypothetical protein
LAALGQTVTHGHLAKIWIFAAIMVFAFWGLFVSVIAAGMGQLAAQELAKVIAVTLTVSA